MTARAADAWAAFQFFFYADERCSPRQVSIPARQIQLALHTQAVGIFLSDLAGCCSLGELSQLAGQIARRSEDLV